jgi:hypothetical protein
MKRFPQGDLRLDEKCFKDNLSKGDFIFVGSSTDIWAKNIDIRWIRYVLWYCKTYYNQTKYLFQSKNPQRFNEVLDFFPQNTIFSTTIETNRSTLFSQFSKLDNLYDRIHFSHGKFYHGDVMLTIEPIMDFDIMGFSRLIKELKPYQVNIGADSGHNNLPEPPAEKILELIVELKKFTKVHLKDNLQRLILK